VRRKAQRRSSGIFRKAAKSQDIPLLLRWTENFDEELRRELEARSFPIDRTVIVGLGVAEYEKRATVSTTQKSVAETESPINSIAH